jgi:hypothetical protein
MVEIEKATVFKATPYQGHAIRSFPANRFTGLWLHVYLAAPLYRGPWRSD